MGLSLPTYLSGRWCALLVALDLTAYACTKVVICDLSVGTQNFL